MRSSFDTNVLVYFVSGDPLKAARSAAVLGFKSVVSVQVFNEFTAVMRRPRVNVQWSQIDVVLDGVRANHHVVPIDLATHDLASTYARRHQLKVYDANIVAAAVLAGCSTLWSEDMQDGFTIDGLTIRNPYR